MFFGGAGDHQGRALRLQPPLLFWQQERGLSEALDLVPCAWRYDGKAAGGAGASAQVAQGLNAAAGFGKDLMPVLCGA
ncbi:hypothetical protein [Pseudomonas sp. ENNP23]|uniref:hypothetical protein n=1 Tax=Pseudomonas sp. ENNP23 TaxID=1535636 RepID=UPI001112EAF8|nr:hypothetical protein [Pseudomonas sp. ENNP23]